MPLTPSGKGSLRTDLSPNGTGLVSDLESAPASPARSVILGDESTVGALELADFEAALKNAHTSSTHSRASALPIQDTVATEEPSNAGVGPHAGEAMNENDGPIASSTTFPPSPGTLARPLPLLPPIPLASPPTCQATLLETMKAQPASKPKQPSFMHAYGHLAKTPAALLAKAHVPKTARAKTPSRKAASPLLVPRLGFPPYGTPVAQCKAALPYGDAWLDTSLPSPAHAQTMRFRGAPSLPSENSPGSTPNLFTASGSPVHLGGHSPAGCGHG